MVQRRFLVFVISVMLTGAIQGDKVSAQHASAMKALPTLRILSQGNGAKVSNPVVVVFETPADLTKMTMGTHMIEETAPHLHIDLDRRVTMPTMKQLTKVGANRYRFNFGRVKPGRHTIRVYWADAKVHKPMSPVQVVTVTVQ